MVPSEPSTDYSLNLCFETNPLVNVLSSFDIPILKLTPQLLVTLLPQDCHGEATGPGSCAGVDLPGPAVDSEEKWQGRGA